MVTHVARVRINRVRLPILLAVSMYYIMETFGTCAAVRSLYMYNRLYSSDVVRTLYQTLYTVAKAGTVQYSSMQSARSDFSFKKELKFLHTTTAVQQQQLYTPSGDSLHTN